MPLHRNETTQEKSMSFKGEDTFVKENHKFQDNVLQYSRKLQVFQTSTCSQNPFLKVKELGQKKESIMSATSGCQVDLID